MERVRGVHWSIVINNPTNEEKALLKHPNLPACVKQVWWQMELAPTTGTLHIQGAIYTTRIDWTVLKKLFPRANIAVARNADALKNYVKKSSTSVPDSYYTWPETPLNEIVEIDEPETIVLDSVQALEMMARGMPFEPLGPDDNKRFKTIVQQVISDYPRSIRFFTNQNLFYQFKLFFDRILEFVQDAEDGQTEPEEEMPGECLIDRHYHKDSDKLCEGCSSLFCVP